MTCKNSYNAKTKKFHVKKKTKLHGRKIKEEETIV